MILNLGLPNTCRAQSQSVTSADDSEQMGDEITNADQDDEHEQGADAGDEGRHQRAISMWTGI